eukprot:UN28745
MLKTEGKLLNLMGLDPSFITNNKIIPQRPKNPLIKIKKQIRKDREPPMTKEYIDNFTYFLGNLINYRAQQNYLRTRKEREEIDHQLELLFEIFNVAD